MIRSAGPAGAGDLRAYVESFVPEDDALLAGRARAEELGCEPITPAGGAILRLLAAATGARAVVEVGTGTGVSGLWLLRGMRADGVLTTVDTEAEHQRAARLTFAEGGVSANRTRLINGVALNVLPRLADGAYDMVFCDAPAAGYTAYLVEALRLLRPGGVVAFNNAMYHGRVPDQTARDAETVAARELVKAVRDHDRLLSALVHAGHGLLCAVRT